MRLKLTGSIGGRNLLEEYNMKDRIRKPEIRMRSNLENDDWECRQNKNPNGC